MRSGAGKVKGGSQRREAMCSGASGPRKRKPRLLKAGAPLLNNRGCESAGLSGVAQEFFGCSKAWRAQSG